ncbi:terminase family protein, partial [Devosia sp. ZB163]|uniref:terminase large subunit domain-containing protein n=1 Tax=Devosia sp. ZB163 TaxID=3025938 RepID=UPI00235FB431
MQTASSTAALRIALHPKQWVAFLSPATEILYGGAAGGGKSHLMRQAAISWCAEIPGLQVYLFRRIREDLIKNHMEGPSGFRSLLAGWVECGFVTIVEDEIRFWNGSKIYLCHCKDEKDRFKYQGAEIHVLLIDELTHFTEVIYRFLRNRVRMTGITVPDRYNGMFPRIMCGANPGGVGHQFVKITFIDPAKPLEIYRAANDEGGMLRQYIPARLEDNPTLAEEDPLYEARLHGLGSEALVRAMRYGDWDVVDGAFFDCWSERLHVIEPFAIPDDWAKFRSGDWGSARPFSFG